MKKFKLLTLAFAALAFGACSSDDVVLSEGNGQPEWNADGTGYINVSIGLPTRTGNLSRAVNDQFSDGSSDEYAVKNVTLIFFKGTTANAATFVAAYDMNMSWNDDNSDQITTVGTKVQRINSITKNNGENIYALAVVNRNNVFTVDGNSLKIDGQTFNGSFADFTAKTVSSETDFNANGFYMTNAVLVDKSGVSELSSPTTTILVDVSSDIYPTAQEAQEHPAAEIYVERGVAKVQLTENISGDSKLSVDYAGSNTDLTYDIAGWALANKNISSYLVRNWSQSVNGITPSGDAWYALYSNGDGITPNTALDANKYRFAGITAIDATATDKLYRTYWGIDPNYNSAASFSAITDQDINTDEIKYCLENTFDVTNQNVKNTTCAIVKAQFTLPSNWGSNNFYTINDNRSVIYKLDDAKTAAASTALTTYEDAATTALKEEAKEAGKSGTINLTVEATLAATADNDTKQVKITAVTITGKIGSGDPAEWTGTYQLSEDQLAALNSTFVITEYTNAYAYYPVLIKHFGDELTPWNRNTKTDTSYPTADANNNWLGRYSVLRNNWYEISVTGISGIGSATIPDVNVDVTPDDEVANYISCQINVLSWAKRTQSVVLQ